jgi:hypothetical protein
MSRIIQYNLCTYVPTLLSIVCTYDILKERHKRGPLQSLNITFCPCSTNGRGDSTGKDVRTTCLPACLPVYSFPLLRRTTILSHCRRAFCLWLHFVCILFSLLHLELTKNPKTIHKRRNELNESNRDDHHEQEELVVLSN